MLTPETTLAEIAADERLSAELAEIILANGARGSMAARNLSYDSADYIASGIRHGVINGLERLSSCA